MKKFIYTILLIIPLSAFAINQKEANVISDIIECKNIDNDEDKIDCFEKQSQLVLTANDDIIWLCGQRISDKVKVTKNTSTMMELSYGKYVQL